MSKRIYSIDPADWKIKCMRCNCDIFYKTEAIYLNAIRKLKWMVGLKCRSCAATGHKWGKEQYEMRKNRIITEETRKKIGLATIKRYKNMSDEDRKNLSKKHSDANKRWWDNIDEESRQARLDNRDIAIYNMSDDDKRLKNEKISRKARERMKLLGGFHKGFRPAYNPLTIPYINEVLNTKYKTIFINAESDGGEFKIRDNQEKRYYYADAYSKELNIWVEFDESHHFRNNKIKKLDKLRQKRIEDILKCTFIRLQISEIDLKTYKEKI